MTLPGKENDSTGNLARSISASAAFDSAPQSKKSIAAVVTPRADEQRHHPPGFARGGIHFAPRRDLAPPKKNQRSEATPPAVKSLRQFVTNQRQFLATNENSRFVGR